MKDLLKGIAIGLVIAVLTGWLCSRECGQQDPAIDLSPFHDSIKVLKRERAMAEQRSRLHLRRADSILGILNDRRTIKHDIKVIESFTPDSRRMWHDSVMRSAGLR